MAVMSILMWVGKTAVSKLFDVGLKKVLGVDVRGTTLENWGETMVLAIFTGGSMVPEPTAEMKVEMRFQDIEKQLGELRHDLTELKQKMASFEWKVEKLFYRSREESLWQDMLTLDNLLDSKYAALKSFGLQTYGRSPTPMADRRRRALEIARDIVSSLSPKVMDSRLALLGESVGTGDERVRGFLEIWREQALRDADMGWDGERLASIYSLLEAKFTRALLIQVKCVRLLMEAYEALQREGEEEMGGLDYLVNGYYPVLKAEVDGFRDVVESIAINLQPLPTGTMMPLSVAPEIAGMLAALDLYLGQAMIGNLTAGSGEAQGPRLPAAPAVSACWGRVIVGGTRWVRRAPGSKEAARVVIQANGQAVTLGGTLEVRAVRYTPYTNEKGDTLHRGYQLQVGNDPRDMDRMLVAHFTPADVLPSGLDGTYDARLEDAAGEVLARTKATVLPVALGEAKVPATYGSFTMGFTGGAALRGR
jgi:hypothetical protein